MEYKTKTEEGKSLGTEYNPKEVHYWRPPCSCGIELGEAIEVEGGVEIKAKGEVHFWRPPCSCGVPLEEVF